MYDIKLFSCNNRLASGLGRYIIVWWRKLLAKRVNLTFRKINEYVDIIRKTRFAIDNTGHGTDDPVWNRFPFQKIDH